VEKYSQRLHSIHLSPMACF